MEQNQTNKNGQNAAVIQLKNETWRLALQTFLNILIATIISVIVVLSLSSLMGSVWGKLVVEAVSLAVTLPMVYGYMWGHGDRDCAAAAPLCWNQRAGVLHGYQTHLRNEQAGLQG